MASKTENGNTDIGGATAQSQSAPQNPINFLKGFNGQKVKIKFKGEFIEYLLGKFGKTLKTEVFRGYFEGTYKVEINLGDVLLRYPYHVVQILKVEYMEVNGVIVKGD